MLCNLIDGIIIYSMNCDADKKAGALTPELLYSPKLALTCLKLRASHGPPPSSTDSSNFMVSPWSINPFMDWDLGRHDGDVSACTCEKLQYRYNIQAPVHIPIPVNNPIYRLQLYLGLSSGVTVTSTQKSRQELAINRRRESLLGQGGASRPAVRPTSYEAGLTACYFGKVVSVVNHVNLQD
jgi:hypothetical protein